MSRTNYTCKYDDERHRRLREAARRCRSRHPETYKRANKNSRERHKKEYQARQKEYAKAHPLAAVHGSMMKRCGHHAGRSDFLCRYYKGRGIEVCQEWRSFPVFEEWALSNGYVKGLQLDRIDPDKGYSPDNCRFVTPHENALNRRSSIRVLWNGEFIELMRLYERIKPKVSYSTAYDRFHRGWSVEDAFYKPIRQTKKEIA